jgi:hypothetical protein
VCFRKTSGKIISKQQIEAAAWIFELIMIPKISV